MALAHVLIVGLGRARLALEAVSESIVVLHTVFLQERDTDGVVKVIS